MNVVWMNVEYEVRRYPQKKWVTTSMDAFTFEEVESPLFRTLFNYIDGGNEAGVVVPMTAPVTTLIIPGEGPNCKQTFRMSFFVPEEFQESPPVPTNQAVYIEDRPEIELYSRQFSGYASENDFITEGYSLYQLLEADAVADAQYAPWYMVGYNSPYDFVNRRNEVWFLRTVAENKN
ncbi:hypothetical protein QYM36_007311 [Artemia franciscana]|uniref:Heme-binding protein 1 n=1 Tax=Artemia franciscana TaxID=6661 RepID=A0AA88I869_ARTSF|nr:hypothetical protein QYM36_007311 [Artemia franciscana]